MEVQKKKILMFHPSLAPYRIDQFNSLNELFDLTVVFLFDNIWNNKMDQAKLLSQCNFRILFLLEGPQRKDKVFFRFGMLRMIKKIQPDIIMGFEYSLTTQFLILWKQLGIIRQKIGTTVDDSMDICNNMPSKVRFLARKWSIRFLDFLVVMSDEVSGFYQENFKLKECQLIVSPILQNPEKLRANGEELETIAQQYLQKYNLKNKKVLLFVGRLAPEKALPSFLSTISSDLLTDPDRIFAIVGEGPEFSLLQTIVEEKKLHDNIIFTGRLEGNSLYAWYLCGSGLVLPSISETFGAVVNEALIFGMPVLCSCYAGASSLITSGKGLIFNPSDKHSTIERTMLFLKTIKSVGEIRLADKPSMMENYQSQFNKEWAKLTNSTSK
ncbi:MAG TPA: glycosyltransferase [Petrimonas sp.]|uniref:glycosyltransferase family 4 protein n=1 Tax=Petrimonas sp. TaxID=2023866 RepID=UPI001775D53F|nr:glycosyltransferase [Petrimonas sp.]MEA5063449.1 glycosyltransferase [Petrimonas sp.]HHV87125.1 glycosyltransferase [Petrimonas sp.]